MTYIIFIYPVSVISRFQNIIVLYFDRHLFYFLDWDREKLLEAWMSNPENCCQRSGVQMPTPPPSGYNAWDTLPSPRTPRTTRSSVTSPDEISLSPGDLDTSLVWLSVFPIALLLVFQLWNYVRLFHGLVVFITVTECCTLLWKLSYFHALVIISYHRMFLWSLNYRLKKQSISHFKTV